MIPVIVVPGRSTTLTCELHENDVSSVANQCTAAALFSQCSRCVRSFISGAFGVSSRMLRSAILHVGEFVLKSAHDRFMSSLGGSLNVGGCGLVDGLA